MGGQPADAGPSWHSQLPWIREHRQQAPPSGGEEKDDAEWAGGERT